ncbi:HMG box-containing protein 1, partial [Orchesella cincta]
WCAVKPEVFQETYGTPCQQLEGGDVCLSLTAARSPNNNNNVISINNNANFLHQQQSLLHHNSGFPNSLIHGSPNNVAASSGVTSYSSNSIINTSSGNLGGVAVNVLANMHNISHLHSGNNSNMNNNSIGNPSLTSLLPTSSSSSMKMETIDEKPIPISVLPQNQHSGIHMQIMQSPPPPPLQHQQAHHHHHQRNSGGNGIGNSRKTAGSIVAPGSPAKRAKDGKDTPTGDQPAKGRRPMNAFLLFAKDKRPELIQKYPGKDNRTISVLLGEAWQKLAAPERERYASSAKARAEEQKRIHPDCWKRKRSQSTSS